MAGPLPVWRCCGAGDGDMSAKKKGAKRVKRAAKSHDERSTRDVEQYNALQLARRAGWLAACREPDGGGVKGCAQMLRAGSCDFCEAVAARKYPLVEVPRRSPQDRRD